MKSDSGRQSGSEGDLAFAQTLVSSDDVLGDLAASREQTRREKAASDSQSSSSSKRNVADVPIGTLFGNFEIVRKLGVGGMGVVYEAKHRTIGRRAAVKLMHPDLARAPGYAARFLNEARAVNIIQHPGLVEIFEYGQQPDGTLFIVMEFLRGESLEQRMSRHGQPLRDAAVIDIGQQLARALSAAHTAGVIHRDLKPENIMLVADPIRPGHDWVKILDFGIAKLGDDLTTGTTDRPLEQGAVIGTPAYMAPEQFGRAELSDGKTDVFALGVVLFELLTGSLPYGRTSLDLKESSAAELRSRLVAVRSALAELIVKMIAQSAASRPSMAEVSQTLSDIGKALEPQLGKSIVAKLPLRLRPVLAIVVCGVIGFLVVSKLVIPSARPSRAELQKNAIRRLTDSLASAQESRRISALRALGQSHDSSLRALIEPSLQSPRSELVSAAASALGRMRAIESQALVLHRLTQTQDPRLKLTLAESLARLDHPDGVSQLRELLDRQSTEPEIRLAAAATLLQLGNLSGRKLLWDALERGKISELSRLTTLGSLAMSGDRPARMQLNQVLSSAAAIEARLFAAYSLARTGDDRGYRFLADEEAQRGQAQVLAAQLLSSLGDARGRTSLLQAAIAKERPEATRELALQGLADCGNEEVLWAVYNILRSPDSSETLRDSSAGVLLRILREQRELLPEQSLLWAQAALESSSTLTRELAVASLGQIGSDDAIAPLRLALHDPAKEVRRGAAVALGRKKVRAALLALKEGLADQDVEVRDSTLHAISRVLFSLRERGDKSADTIVLPQLSKVSQTGAESEQVAASAILFQLGDEQQRARLLAALHSSQPLVRRLALEFAPADENALTEALTDVDRGVRFTAAKRLLERGSQKGIPALRDAAKLSDVTGLIAYGKLRSIGENVTIPEGIPQLLTASDLSVRLQALDALADMPPERAIGFLLLASRDLAGALRHRVAEVARAMYSQTGSSVLLHLLERLAKDSDPLVRSAAVIPKLQPKVAPTEVAFDPVEMLPAPHAAEAVTTADSVSASEAEKSVPVQEAPLHVDRAVAPLRSADKLLRDATEAFSAKQYDRARGICDKLRVMERRGLVPRTVVPQLALLLGKLYEVQKDLTRALQEYNRVKSMQESSPQQRREVDQAMSRLAFSVGHIVVHRNRGGGKPGCVRDDLFLVPGNHLVDVGAGQTELVRVEAGTSVTLSKCRQ